MKKQLFLAVALLACLSANQADAAKLKFDRNKQLALSGLGFVSSWVTNHLLTAYRTQEKTGRDGKKFLEYSDPSAKLCSDKIWDASKLALLPVLADNETLVNMLHKVPGLSYLFTDSEDVDADEVTTSRAARYAAFALLLHYANPMSLRK